MLNLLLNSECQIQTLSSLYILIRNLGKILTVLNSLYIYIFHNELCLYWMSSPGSNMDGRLAVTQRGGKVEAEDGSNPYHTHRTQTETFRCSRRLPLTVASTTIRLLGPTHLTTPGAKATSSIFKTAEGQLTIPQCHRLIPITFRIHTHSWSHTRMRLHSLM